MTTPLGTATLLATAMLTPEQSAPMIAATLSEVIRRSAAACAAAASTQVESPRTGMTFLPPRNAPDSVASFMANSAAATMLGTRDSIGPVKPISTPTFMSACAAEANITNAAEANRERLIFRLLHRVHPECRWALSTYRPSLHRRSERQASHHVNLIMVSEKLTSGKTQR